MDGEVLGDAPHPVDARGGQPFGLATTLGVVTDTGIAGLNLGGVVVGASQLSMIRLLKEHGFKPIPCPMMNYKPFGGAFHCTTLDILRRGALQSYF